MIVYYIDDKVGVCHAKLGKFPGGEVMVSTQPHHNPAGVTEIAVCASTRNSDELMQLIMFIDAAKRQFNNAVIDVMIPYFPYARQDRVCNPGESHSLAVVAKMLNTTGVRFTVIDPHSDVLGAVLDRVNVVTLSDLYSQKTLDLPDFHNLDALISPDAGALKKVTKLAEVHYQLTGKQIPVIVANKKRDLATGRITESTLSEPVDGMRVLVVDDICDGGATFIALSNLLIKAKYKALYVTHGIFSKGVAAVSQFYDEIYTTNSFNPELESEGNLIVSEAFY